MDTIPELPGLRKTPVPRSISAGQRSDTRVITGVEVVIEFGILRLLSVLMEGTMRVMETEADRWRRVGEAISARFDELRISKAEFIERSGISDKTLNRYLAGEPIRRVDKARELCDALGWTPDSLDLILEGRDPVVTLPGRRDEVLVRLDENHRLLVEILEELRARPR